MKFKYRITIYLIISLIFSLFAFTLFSNSISGKLMKKYYFAEQKEMGIRLKEAINKDYTEFTNYIKGFSHSIIQKPDLKINSENINFDIYKDLMLVNNFIKIWIFDKNCNYISSLSSKKEFENSLSLFPYPTFEEFKIQASGAIPPIFYSNNDSEIIEYYFIRYNKEQKRIQNNDTLSSFQSGITIVLARVIDSSYVAGLSRNLNARVNLSEKNINSNGTNNINYKKLKYMNLAIPLKDRNSHTIAFLDFTFPWEKYPLLNEFSNMVKFFFLFLVFLFFCITMIVLFIQVFYPINIIGKVFETKEIHLFYKLKFASKEMKNMMSLLIRFFEQEEILKNEILERAEISQALKNSEEKYRTLVTNLPDAVLVYQNDKLLFVNQKAVEILGYSESDIFTKSILSIIHPEDHDLVVKNIQAKLDNINKFPPYEIRIIHKDGHLIPCMIYAHKILYHNDKATLVVISDISEIKKTQGELIESKERLSSILNNIPFLAWMKDLHGRFTEVNDNFCTFIKKKPEEVIGKTDYDLYSHPTASKFYEKDLLVMRTKEKISFEDTEYQENKLHWIETYKTPLFDFKGSVIGIVGLSHDITERKLMEQALIESEEKFREITESLDEAIWLGKNKRFSYLSPGFQKIWEKDPEYLLNKPDFIMDSIIPDDKMRVKKIFDDFHLGKLQSIDIETKIIPYSGTQKWIWVRIFKIGENSEKILGIAEEITQKKNSEEKLGKTLNEMEKVNKELKKLNEELAKEIMEREKAKNILRRYEFIVNASQESMTLINDSYKYEAVNDYFCNSHKIQREKVIGYHASKIWGKEIFNNIIKPRVDDALHGESNNYKEWFSFGTLGNRFISATYYPYKDSNKPIKEVVIISHDITELKDYSDKLQELNSNLESMVNKAVEDLRQKDQMIIQQSRLAAMGEMIGNIAHQWRQPLNSLALLIQNLKESFDFNELDANHMENAEKQSLGLINHMSQTIDDFRNFFKPDKQQTDFSVQDSVQKVLEIIGATFENHGITIHNEILDNIIITGYPNEFGQVVLNLLSNAKDSLLERQITKPQIWIKSSIRENEKIIEVFDNAGGIPENILSRIFEPYFTTKSYGTGIGLYMSKSIIERNMNGELTVTNNELGACFKIIFKTGNNGEKNKKAE